MLQPLAAGNAVRVFIQPPDGANCWRVLRNTTGTFAGPSDPDAVIVAARSTEESVLDLVGLINNVEYFYRDYASADGGNSWIDSGSSLSATPSTSYFDVNPDPQELVRDRLELGLAAVIARGELIPTSGTIKVTTAPFALADGLSMPCVSVHLDTSASGERGIGEAIDIDYADLSGDVEATSGWLARVRLQIVAVSLNSDERIALRKAIRRIVQANFPVWDDAGMVQVNFSQTDSERFVEDGAPQYLTSGSFDCLAPAAIVERDPYITEIILEQVGAHGAPIFLGTDDLPGIDDVLIEETVPLRAAFNITAYGDVVSDGK